MSNPSKSETKALPQPLTGIKILDLSQTAAGPLCSMMLADMGADVIKVEIPGRGDGLRHWGPPFLGGEGVYFLGLNRNKKSMTLNLKSQQGKDIFYKILLDADVLIENFRPGTMERLGLTYEEIIKKNPRIVYCRISGYGQNGPYYKRGGYDLIAQGESGIMLVTGEEERPPSKVGIAVVDFGTGMNAAYGVLAALFAREKIGTGQIVDVALFDTAIYWMTFQQIGAYLASKKPAKRLGTAHPVAAPYEAYKTKDIYITIGCSADRNWKKLCDILGKNELINDPRFLTNPKRVENRKSLTAILSQIFSTKKGDEWLRELREVGIPCGPINTLNKVVSDPQLLHREMLVEMNHPTAGTIKVPGIPVKLSQTPGEIKIPPPKLGQHTKEILLDLGYNEEEIQDLQANKVI
jgi:crotonobetainyl-CoA:carnitine CoA-transferase CaiB-like acyl-CoA transferase